MRITKDALINVKLREDVQTVNFFLTEWEAAVQEQSAISINNSHAKKKKG